MRLQYIGARYVPIWYQNTDDQSANWQSNVEYEPLTYVTTINNHLYLSKKTVPDTIGNPADNIEYWLDLGVFITGQYELLQEQIDDMKDGDVSGSLQNQIDFLKEGSKNENMRLIVLTDSYGVSPYAGGTPFIDQMATLLGLSSDDFYGFAQGSAGIAPNTAVPRTIKGVLEDNISSVVSPETITHVLYALGANDITRDSGIGTYFESLVTYTRSVLPNAKIVFAFIGQTYNESISDHNKAYEAYRVCSAQNRCEFIDNSDLIMRVRKNLAADRIHPSSAGSDALAKYLSIGLINGTFDFSDTGTFTVTIGGTDVPFVYYISNDICNIIAGTTTLTTPTAITRGYAAFTTNDCPIRGSGSDEALVTFEESGATSSSVGQMTITGSAVYFKVGGSGITATKIAMPTFTNILRNNN